MKILQRRDYTLISEEPGDIAGSAYKAALELVRSLRISISKIVAAENGHGLPKYRVRHGPGKGPNIGFFKK